MAHETELPTARAWLVLLCIEAMVAGVLWLIGLFGPVLLIVTGVASFLALMFWDKGWYWRCVSVVLIFVLAVTILGLVKWRLALWQKQDNSPAVVTPAPSTSDINIVLVAERVSTPTLEAHFKIINKAKVPATLEIFNYHVPGDINGSKNNIQVLPGEERDIAIWHPNRLMQARAITVEYSYSFLDTKSDANGSVNFDIPADIKPGSVIKPAGCCKKEKSDLAVGTYKQIEYILATSKSSDNTIDKIPEITSLGYPLIGIFGTGPKVLMFNMKTRLVEFIINQYGRIRVFRASVGKTMDGLHSFRIWWEDGTEIAGLAVDGVKAPLIEDKNK